jgi:hypothetical protein
MFKDRSQLQGFPQAAKGAASFPLPA